MKRVYIEWVDSFSMDHWQPEQSAINNADELMYCSTIGFEVTKNKEMILICHTINREGSVCGVIQIPRRCITNIQYLINE